MEKSNSRARRNGTDPEKAKSKTTPANNKAQGSAPVATNSGRWEPPEIAPGLEAQQRIERPAGTATIERATSPRGLQDTFVDERNDVLAVINELEDQLDRQQDIRETLERELTNTSEQLQTANQRVQELEWHVVTLQTRVDALEQLRTDVASLEEELGDTNARAQRTHEQLVLTEKERTRLKAELKAANKHVDELWAVRKERDGLRSEYKTLSAKVEELERNQREIIEHRAEVQAQLHETQIALEETTAERNQLQTTLRGTEDGVRELTRVQESLVDKMESLRADKKNLQVHVTHLERENARLAEQRQFYECEVTSLRNQSRTAETALTSVKKAFSEVRIALTETKTRARRRTLDTWPRIGSPLRGITAEEMAESAAAGIPVAATVGAEEETAETQATTDEAPNPTASALVAEPENDARTDDTVGEAAQD